jgi:hypothetical protein
MRQSGIGDFRFAAIRLFMFVDQLVASTLLGALSAMLRITVGDLVFSAEFVDEAPLTVEAFRKVLPFEQKLIQARWSGESAWIPLGEYKLGVGFENATSYPAAGEVLFYPGGYSETEILFPYGHTSFASTLGQLAGNHFITITEGRDQLKEVGRRVVWEGAQTIRFELAE